MAEKFKSSGGTMFGVTGILFVVILLNVGSSPVSAGEKPHKCQEITIPMCRGIGYNLTYMPNQFNHDTQVRIVNY